MTEFLLLNTKEDILKNVGNQHFPVPIDFPGIPPLYDRSENQQLFSYPDSSKYLLLCLN